MAAITRGASLLLCRQWKQWGVYGMYSAGDWTFHRGLCASDCIKLTRGVLKSFWKFYVCLELLNLSGHIHAAKRGLPSSKWRNPMYCTCFPDNRGTY